MIGDLDPNLVYRNEQIPKIVTELKEMAEIYAQISALVIEQGTTMDRIDANVYSGKQTAIKANNELKITLEREKSWRATGCLICLV
jgi:t-SNARE complex subunit (syntaxin)